MFLNCERFGILEPASFIRKSASRILDPNPEPIIRNPLPQNHEPSPSSQGGRHEPEALKSAAPKGTDGVLNFLGLRR